MMKKIEPPKITEVLAEIKVTYVKIEGQAEPMVMLNNENKHPNNLVKDLLATGLMIISQVEKEIVNGN